MKVVFAHINKLIDFPTYESAIKYEKKAREKGYYIEKPVYHNGKADNDNPYSIVVLQPISGYYSGF